MKRYRYTHALAIVLAIIGFGPVSMGADDTAKKLEELARKVAALEEKNARLEAELQLLKPPVAKRNATPAPVNKVAVDSSRPLKAADLKTRLDEEITSVNFDRPMAAAPAFVALDVTPETITNPASPREFAASLLNGVDRDGVLQTGIAIETAPYQLIYGPRTTLEDYRASYWTRLLYNASLSIGTTKAGGDDSEAQRLAAGISFQLYDRGDFRMDKELEEIARKLGAASPVGPGSEIPQTTEEAEEQLESDAANFPDIDSQFAAAKAMIRARSWASTSWQIAWAPTWLSESGKAGDLRYDGSVVWSTFAYGFEDFKSLRRRAQFLVQLRYQQGELVVDPDNADHKADQDTLFAAARFRFGSPDFNGWFEGAYIRRWHGLDGNGDAMRAGGGIEKRIAPNMWLVLSIGQDFGGGDGGEELFALGSLRFGSADTPRFESPASN